MRASFALLLPLCSCGLVMNGGPFPTPISSDPPGAVVTLEGAEVGKTPCTVALRRKHYKLELSLEGYHKQIVDPGTKGNGWVAGNILLGGIPGIIIDMLGGGTYVIDSDPVYVKLSPNTAPAPSAWERPKPVYVPGGDDF